MFRTVPQQLLHYFSLKHYTEITAKQQQQQGRTRGDLEIPNTLSRPPSLPLPLHHPAHQLQRHIQLAQQPHLAQKMATGGGRRRLRERLVRRLAFPIYDSPLEESVLPTTVKRPAPRAQHVPHGSGRAREPLPPVPRSVRAGNRGDSGGRLRDGRGRVSYHRLLPPTASSGYSGSSY